MSPLLPFTDQGPRRALAPVLLLGLLLLFHGAGAVSRVGGGSAKNPQEGFVTPLPAGFTEAAVDSEGNFQLYGPLRMGDYAGGPGPQIINIYLLRNQRPDLAGVTDRAAVVADYTAKSWRRESHPDACVEVFSADRAGGLNRVVAWGDGKGLMLVGPPTPLVARALDELIRHLEIDPEACAWSP